MEKILKILNNNSIGIELVNKGPSIWISKF